MLVFFVWPQLAYSQGFNRQLQEKLNGLQGVTELLQHWEGLGIKEIGTTGLKETSSWLDSIYQDMGYRVLHDSFTDRGIPLHNVIIEKHARDSSAKWLIISAHYDTRTGTGTNDNGSGVVACIEIARLLASIECRINVRIIHFSGEEYGLSGSRHYVNKSLAESPEEVLLVFNLDQLGGTAGSPDNEFIYTERDEDAPFENNTLSDSLTQILFQLTRTYSALKPVVSRAFGSDYVPFQQEGYVVNGLYQYSAYPYYHTANDKLENMDVKALEQVIRAAAAYVLYLAGPQSFTLGIDKGSKDVQTRIYPNPASDFISIEGQWVHLYIRDATGRLLKSVPYQKEFIPLFDLQSDCYILELRLEENHIEYRPLIIVH
jgi:aminopeptidase YwaD